MRDLRGSVCVSFIRGCVLMMSDHGMINNGACNPQLCAASNIPHYSPPGTAHQRKHRILASEDISLISKHSFDTTHHHHVVSITHIINYGLYQARAGGQTGKIFIWKGHGWIKFYEKICAWHVCNVLPMRSPPLKWVISPALMISSNCSLDCAHI